MDNNRYNIIFQTGIICDTNSVPIHYIIKEYEKCSRTKRCGNRSENKLRAYNNNYN